MKNDIEKVCYGLFEQSGNIGYYMLMRKLGESGDGEANGRTDSKRGRDGDGGR